MWSKTNYRKALFNNIENYENTKKIVVDKFKRKREKRIKRERERERDN